MSNTSPQSAPKEGNGKGSHYYGYEQQKKWRSNLDNHKKYLDGLKRWRSNNQDHIEEYRRQYKMRRLQAKVLKEISEILNTSRARSSSRINNISSKSTMEVSA